MTKKRPMSCGICQTEAQADALLYAAAHEAHAEGIPMMRAMLLEFPGDNTCHWLDRQYMLGGRLLVAPVFRKTALSVIICQKARGHTFDGKETEGGEWKEERYGYMGLPLFVRETHCCRWGRNPGDLIMIISTM
ncbi:glycoside hydrolase family 31 protein [Bacillus licheniformis]|nr:glycoside hydrolase family 31 protein [Bacillus licheniformis]